MIHEYEHQSDAKELLGKGDIIYFKDMKEGGNPFFESVNSGMVSFVDGTHVDIDNVNGDGDSITRRLNEIVLCYASGWDSNETEPVEKPADTPNRCPVCNSVK